MFRSHVLICGGTGCVSAGSDEVVRAFEEQLAKRSLSREIAVLRTGCLGPCAVGPIVIVYPEGCYYKQVSAADVPEIVEQHLMGGRILKRLLYDESSGAQITKSLNYTDFYKKQQRVALRNCGIIDPESIAEYIAADGYQALAKCLTELQPEEVIQTVKDSGLRGRGGGGFPTGLKWEFASKNAAPQKHVICNADEGDPGAFMDRSILEGDPHCIVEAMTICGYATGATEGYVYVRAEYPVAVKRLEIAISAAKKAGPLGENIFDSGFSFDLQIRLGAGAFVCGEETALMTSIEGNRGEPRPRPPYPAERGLFNLPTTTNNVETFANIPQIILKGADYFAAMGTERSKGTKVFALGGNIKNTGLVEIPMGTTLREIVEEIGGGIPYNKQFKAAQTGGPSGGCIPASHLDTEIDYDNLRAIGCMMGSGGLIVMDEDNCMVDIARYFLDFTVDESCGKCSPCRIGTKRMLELLDKIIAGNGTAADLDKLEELAHHVSENSLCGLGQSAPNPVLATLKFFRSEYEAHVEQKRCPAGVCKALLRYVIDAEKCIGCTLCARQCPTGAIIGKPKEAHVIDQSKCIKCGACVDACKRAKAVLKV